MGTSLVKYREFGYWTRDSFLESWLIALADEVEKMPSPEPWQKSLAQHWRIQAKVDGGVISVGLDEFLTDDRKKDFVLAIAKEALKHTQSPEQRTGELFVDLLAGKLKSTASTPIDYLE